VNVPNGPNVSVAPPAPPNNPPPNNPPSGSNSGGSNSGGSNSGGSNSGGSNSGSSNSGGSNSGNVANDPPAILGPGDRPRGALQNTDPNGGFVIPPNNQQPPGNQAWCATLHKC
jgi:hypothetical protein